MKILIIGGTGNISTPTTRILVERGHDVTLYNRGSKRIEGTKYIVGDRGKYTSFEKQMQEAGEFDCVIDMIVYDPEDVRSAVRVFRGRVGQYLFCSTCDVYTKPSNQYPIKEDFERKPDPAFSYAFKKAACEFILEEAYARGDFPVTIIRPAATYQDAWTPISLLGPGTTLMRRIRQGRPVIVMGDGTSFWVSSHRDDVGRTFAEAAGNTLTYGKAYHVTGDETMTWEEYFQTVGRVMIAPPINFVHIPADLLGRIAPKSAEWCMLNFKFNNIFDNSAAKKDLKYRYTITWEEGVHRMVRYHDEQGEIDQSPEYPFYDRIIAEYENNKSKLVEMLSPLDV